MNNGFGSTFAKRKCTRHITKSIMASILKFHRKNLLVRGGFHTNLLKSRLTLSHLWALQVKFGRQPNFGTLLFVPDLLLRNIQVIGMVQWTYLTNPRKQEK